jgi:hypothetical protein
LSEDPLHLKGGDNNLYRYTYNSPLSYVDPNGKEISFLGAIGIGAFVGGIAGAAGEIIGNDNWTGGSVWDAAVGGAAGGAATVIGAGAAIVGSGVSLAGAAGSALFGITVNAGMTLILDPSTIPSPIAPHTPPNPSGCP